jgi:hypothetical protein
LFVVTLGVDFAHADSARQSANAISTQNVSDASVRDCDALVSLQVPDDSIRPEVIFASQVKEFVGDLKRGSITARTYEGERFRLRKGCQSGQ